MPPAYLLFLPRRFLSLTAAFLLGCILGAVLTSLLIGHQVDKLYFENETLKEALQAANSELEEVKQNLAARKRQVITSIEPHVIFPEDNLSSYEQDVFELALGKEIKRMLEPVRGKEVKAIDYILIPEIINNRLLKVEGRNFRLETKMIIVTDKLIVRVEAFPEKLASSE
ncbi:hypothetical protein [Calderihabitans maritimus]|uniref:Sporulation membrane protein YtrI C-terminal domain-containing protein n=1 Tax=Calderihabitans maritimus TaxID=1246530 RepID=A0A1Z5HP22_9FIRM|nr:hypothetical protein [Calderihabitans maritimus]GAW91282.1 hypothetical protein Desgi_1899 [Calderihabitans maritimus]